MAKILVIGVGSSGRTIVNKMEKDGDMEDTKFMTVGHYLTLDEEMNENVPHYNLITMNGLESIPAGSNPVRERKLAENVEDQFRKIIKQKFEED